MEIVKSYLTKNPCYTNNVNKADSRYTAFQQRGPLGLMLHSVGCAQPDASVFIRNWDKPTYTNACVHGFIDANSGVVFQTLPWNFRGWHCAGSGNNTHIGVEMCESSHIRYLKVGESGYAPGKFVILDKAKALADCTRTYHAAVELFAMLCKEYNLDPLTKIVSHNEGGKMGIASGHIDPEHYWSGLGAPYTMDGFRRDVKRTMEDTDMTREEVQKLLKEQAEAYDKKLVDGIAAVYKQFESLVNANTASFAKVCNDVVTSRIGKQIADIADVPESLKPETRKLLDCGAINGGTDSATNPDDVNMPYQILRAVIVASRYADYIAGGDGT